MIIVLKQHSGQKEIDRVENLIKTKGLDTHIVKVQVRQSSAVSVIQAVSMQSFSK